eukprot:gene15284-16861_t
MDKVRPSADADYERLSESVNGTRDDNFEDENMFGRKLRRKSLDVMEEGSNGCELMAIIVLEITAILAVLSMAVALLVCWIQSRTILTEFSMNSKKIGLAMLIIFEIFAAIVLTFCIRDLTGRIRKFNSTAGSRNNQNKAGKQTKHKDQEQNKNSSQSPGGKQPSFFLRQYTESLDNKTLMETAMLATNAAEEARLKRLAARPSISVEDEENHQTNSSFGDSSFYKYVNGISFVGLPPDGEVDGGSNVSRTFLRTKVFLAGSSCAGKTSIFSRILFDKYISMPLPTLGIDYGLKTLQLSGKNMFGKLVGLDVGMQIWDTAGHERFWATSLAYLRDHVVLIVVCDVMNGSSISGVMWWVMNIRSKVKDPFVAVFLNKIDLEDRMVTAEDLVGIPALQGVAIYEVSAKTGEGIMESLTQVVCQAICHEAGKIVEPDY